jgi:hypothetical protein
MKQNLCHCGEVNCQLAKIVGKPGGSGVFVAQISGAGRYQAQPKLSREVILDGLHYASHAARNRQGGADADDLDLPG